MIHAAGRELGKEKQILPLSSFYHGNPQVHVKLKTILNKTLTN